MYGTLVFVTSTSESVPETAWALVVVHGKYLIDVSSPSSLHKLNGFANGRNENRLVDFLPDDKLIPDKFVAYLLKSQ
jgi:hypothetical protein